MTETIATTKTKPDRVSVTAFINKDTRDALMCIAAAKDLSFSDVVRAACTEYAKKHNDN